MGKRARVRSHHAAPAEPENPWATVKRIWDYLSKEKLKLIFILFLVATSTLMALLAPYLLGYAIDHYVVNFDPPGRVRLLILLALVYLVTAVPTWLQHLLIVGISERTIYQILIELFEKLQRLS